MSEDRNWSIHVEVVPRKVFHCLAGDLVGGKVALNDATAFVNAVKFIMILLDGKWSTGPGATRETWHCTITFQLAYLLWCR